MLFHLQRIILLLLLFLTFDNNKAAALPLSESRLSFVSAGVEQGLSQSTVQEITQDHIGFMWVGTKDGLNRYDGSSFTVYKHTDEPGSLYCNDIAAIAEAPDGNMLIGFTSGSLNKYMREDDSFTLVSNQVFANNPISDLYVDSGGQIWVATASGLYVSDGTGDNFELFSSSNVTELVSSNAPLQVKEIATGRNQNIWFASRQGLLRYDTNNKRMQLFRNLLTADVTGDNNFTTVCQLFSGNVLVGTQAKGLFLFNTTTNTFTPFTIAVQTPGASTGKKITAIVQDYDGFIWVGTDDQGLFVVHPVTYQAERYDSSPADLLASRSSLSNDRISKLTLARGNRIFIGTQAGGLNMYDSNRITFPRVRKSVGGLASNVIYGFAQGDKPGTIWLATEDGIELWNKAQNTFQKYQQVVGSGKILPVNTCTGVSRDRFSNLWIFTDHGAARYDKDADSFVLLDLKNKKVANSEIRNLLQDSRGNFWYATNNGLVFHNPEAGVLHRYKHQANQPGSLCHDRIKQLFEDEQGRIWIATEAGLSRFDYETGAFTNFHSDSKNPQSIASNKVNCFFEDREAVWLGTSNGGLNKHNKQTGTFEAFAFYDDKYNTTIYSMLEDASGLLWLASNQGLLAFDRGTGKVLMHFTSKDGIQGYEFLPGSALLAHTGEMFFGGINGFNFFSPKNIKQAPVLGPIVCTGISINHVPVKNFSKFVTTSGNLELDFRQTRVTIYFTMLDYQLEGGHQYMYKLEGYKDEWIPNKLNHVTFEKLPAGDYRLLVKGAGADGIWNENPLVVDIHVSPPPWRSTWAMAGYVLLVILVLRHIILRQRKNNLAIEERSRRLSQMVEEKTWELQISVQLLDEKNKKLYFLTMHDELTGFFNRKRFSDVEEDCNNGLFNDKMPFCLIMADIDGLKLTNDHLGHAYGDKLLIEVARIFKESLREEDIACRIGGDEFALIIPNCTQETLAAILERIKVEQAAYNENPQNELYINTSVGYCFLNLGEEFKKAFEKADEMMYEVKKANKEFSSQQIMDKIRQTKKRLGIK